MKKGRIITAAVLAATMLMGAGYAAWNSNVTVNHTVTTGNMNVEFKLPTDYAAPQVTGSTYVKPSVKNNSTKLVSFTLDNLYPGATYTTLTEEKNTGSIGVKFDNAVVTFADGTNTVLKDNVTVDFNCWVFDESGKHIESIKLPVENNIKLANLADALDTALAGVTLQPGQYLRLQGHDVDQLMTFTLNDGAGMNNDTQNKNLSFTIQLNWKQFNK